VNGGDYVCPQRSIYIELLLLINNFDKLMHTTILYIVMFQLTIVTTANFTPVQLDACTSHY